jgi:hypothetical protein
MLAGKTYRASPANGLAAPPSGSEPALAFHFAEEPLNRRKRTNDRSGVGRLQLLPS